MSGHHPLPIQVNWLDKKAVL